MNTKPLMEKEITLGGYKVGMFRKQDVILAVKEVEKCKGDGIDDSFIIISFERWREILGDFK